VRLTNPDKLLYPEASITKQDVAEYYDAVSEWMLPHVVGRPITFVRCQNGWNKGGFFQKHAGGGLAAGVRVVKVGKDDVLAVDDRATLVALAQMNVLEIHTWVANIDALDRANFLVFDIDPDTAIAWSEVVRAAREARDRLILKGYSPLVKTTGGKGLHVCIALETPIPWDEARGIGRSLAEAMLGDSPERFVLDISKAKRKGKILLDFARNHRGATFVAPYSPRARANAPVAMPLSWDDLDNSTPDRFTIKTAIARLRERGNAWKI